MKISFIIYSLGSGGAERVVSLLSNYLVKRGYQVEIITFTTEKSFYELDNRINHIKLGIDFKSKNILEKIINSIKRIKILFKYLKKSNPDVVISFMTHTNILAIIASKLNKQRIIVSEDIEYYFYNSNFLYFIRKVIYKIADILVVKTLKDKNNYSFLNKRKVRVIPNPLPKGIFECKGNKIKEEFVLAVGRLDKQKGFDILIEIYAKINTDWKLYIAGEGSERKTLEMLIKKYNLENKVILLGRVKNIENWYSKASIFVLSSRKEGFGNVLIEAMACECAVVSFDCPYGPSEIIENGKNGILVENQNKEKLREAIELLIKDENLRKKLAKEALKVRSKYSLEKIGKEWEKIIKDVCESTKSFNYYSYL